MAWTGNGGEKQGKWTPEWQRKKTGCLQESRKYLKKKVKMNLIKKERKSKENSRWANNNNHNNNHNNEHL